jgi:multisubunit Na+/H+ antiporter MnhB subunit
MSVTAWNLLDALLVLALLALSLGALHSKSLRNAVILFIVFGLVLALIWARLRAPDVALAEAAIGAGLAGALLLAALADAPSPDGTERPGRLANATVTLLVLVLAAGTGWALLNGLASGDPERLAGAVAAALPHSGVSNPVTAVLLNFRAWDTLLELAVLLAALLGVLALGPARATYRITGAVFGGLVAWLAPLLILTAGYQLWVGAHAPGGAFQAGAVLAAAGVILHLAGRAHAGLPGGGLLRAISVGGVGMFLAAGLGTWLAGDGFLAYPVEHASMLILLIETLATLGIAATLVLIYLGGKPANWRGPLTRGSGQ